MNIVLVGGHGDAGSVHPAWVTWPQRSEEDITKQLRHGVEDAQGNS